MPMNKITVDLQNCYGIRALQQEFNFSDSNVIALYAPNGVMKSSLAQTFKDHANDTPSQDRIFPNRVTSRSIVDSSGNTLSKASILAVSPYEEQFGVTEKTSVLLVDSKLRKEYEDIHADIDASKQEFLQILKKQSGSKKDLETEISLAFTPRSDQFFQALIRARSEVEAQSEALLSDIAYDQVFNERTIAFLDQEDFKTVIEAYVKKYNELLDSSKYFSRDTFNYFNASTIAKSLASNGFFKAKHSVNLNGDEKVELTTQKALETLIADEKRKITEEPDLRERFTAIEKMLTKNAQLRAFQDYLSEKQILLPRLANIDALREDIWKSYFKSHYDLYVSLIEKHLKARERSKEIELEAQRQRTQWEAVIDIFNTRFFVPFKLVLENRERVMLGTENLPRLGFVFDEGEGGDEARVNKETLMRTLSTGERKAFYVLNIIFEVEARREVRQETLFVFDDIADSFDYRNKYAIIQYLVDIAEEDRFKQILLTHNFDFFRTVHHRFVPYRNCLMSEKNSRYVSISQASGIRNPFVLDWKDRFFTDKRKRLASIPFLRNLIEFTSGQDHADFVSLTSLLHWKPDSEGISQDHLDEIYMRTIGQNGQFISSGETVMDTLHIAADSCLKDSSSSTGKIESKVVLSIAIRISAEKFMVEKINDRDFWNGLDVNQTYLLSKRFSEDFPNETHALDIIKRVVLMTPDNIHLNSFMYEPILDMSDEHLKRLYQDVRQLS